MFLTPSSFAKGGISRYTRYQILALRELFGQTEVEVYSVLGPGGDDLESPPLDVTWWAGGISPIKKAAFCAVAAKQAIRTRPRVVLSSHVNLSPLAVALGRAVRARTVVNIYGLEVWSALRRDAMCGLRAADLVISDCYFTKDYVVTKGLRSREAETKVLWDCVDSERFSPGSPPMDVLRRYRIPDPSKHLNVLTLGRMSSQAGHKGYERLLEAFSRIAHRAPPLRLIYAGDGELVNSLREKAARLGMGDRVVFTGSVAERDLADVYRSCHVFSLVSDRGNGRGEGIPLTPLEAASCAKPILVGNQDGSQEAVVHGVNGYVLDPFDLESHARYLNLLCEEPKLRLTMGEAARQRILEFHDYPVFRQHLGLYMKDLGLGPASLATR